MVFLTVRTVHHSHRVGVGRRIPEQRPRVRPVGHSRPTQRAVAGQPDQEPGMQAGGKPDQEAGLQKEHKTLRPTTRLVVRP